MIGVSRLRHWLIPLLLLSQLTAPLQAAQNDQPQTPAQPLPQTAANSDFPDFDAYILGAGDQLQLSFLSTSNANLGGSFQLLNDGSTTLPMIGSVVLEGLTLNQANRWLVGLYRRYLRQPELTLRVMQPRPLQVSVVGQVENPGLYLLNPGGEGSNVEGKEKTIPGLPTVVSAIQKAGGITLNANLSDVRLQRRLPGVSSQLRETQLNLVALLQQGDKRQNPFLFDGDTIVIAPRPGSPAGGSA